MYGEFNPVFPLWLESHPPEHTEHTENTSFFFFKPKTKCYWLLLQSTFPENLLRFSAECENMTVATVKTVILSICWANLRHFGTLMPALKERLTPSCSSNFHIVLNTICFKTRSCILLRIQMNSECESQLLELEALFIECVNITQVGEGSVFRSHTTTHSIWGHFWCVTHPVNDLKSVLHVNKCYLLNGRITAEYRGVFGNGVCCLYIWACSVPCFFTLCILVGGYFRITLESNLNVKGKKIIIAT